MLPTWTDEAGCEWSEAEVELNGFNCVYYHSTPSPFLPKLVFLHGFTSYGAVALPILGALHKEFHMYCPTMRGHGKNAPMPPYSFIMEDLIEDLRLFIKFISAGERVFLVGHSMGAAVVARLAKTHPEILKAIVLEDPPWTRNAGIKGTIKNKGEEMPLALARKLRNIPDEEFEIYKDVNSPGKVMSLGWKTGDARIWWGGLFSTFAPGLLDETPFSPTNKPIGPFQMTMTQHFRCLQEEAISPSFKETVLLTTEAVEGIEVPVLIFTGQPGKAHANSEVVEQTLKTWPLGREKNFPKAGHLIRTPDRQQEYVEEIKTFCQEHIKFGAGDK